jgi:charged multivesicular body protein 4A/B
MMRLFGRTAAPREPSTPEAIQRLRDALALLEKRDALLQGKIDREVAFARDNATRNRRGALAAIKRKRMYETQQERDAAARTTLETQILTLEGSAVTLDTMAAMRAGASTMKAIHGNMTVEAVDEIHEEIAEQMGVADEINAAISQPLGGTAAYDEDDLASELDALGTMSMDDILALADVATAVAVPVAAPVAAPAPPSAEADLAALEASMAM